LTEAVLVELTSQDQQRFVDTLLNPPTPSERLQTAAADYREHLTQVRLREDLACIAPIK